MTYDIERLYIQILKNKKIVGLVVPRNENVFIVRLLLKNGEMQHYSYYLDPC
jgi:hypothetical protein